MNKAMQIGCCGRTYSKVDLAALSNFFWEDMEELEDAGNAIGIVAQGGDDELEHILPLEHLDGEVGQTDA